MNRTSSPTPPWSAAIPPSRWQASRFFAGQRLAPRGDNLPGLGQDAFGTANGIVVVIKDSQSLTVDATGLPVVFGSQQQRRTDPAYEIASDVLGCWTGD